LHPMVVLHGFIRQAASVFGQGPENKELKLILTH
jgi:hypothetical protein